MCVALAALDAVINVVGPDGQRSVPINEFYLLPEDQPQRETVLRRGELIRSVSIPCSTMAKQSHYIKVRDRASYAFALVSAAVALDLQGHSIRNARIALGGVAPKPWRCFEAERSLAGRNADRQSFSAAADLALQGAVPQRFNKFKIELAKRTIIRALESLASQA